MREIIPLSTHTRETLVDITPQVRDLVAKSGVRFGLCCCYAQGATAAILIQESWDESVQTDVVELLRKFCELDGPRSDRRLVCTIIAD